MARSSFRFKGAGLLGFALLGGRLAQAVAFFVLARNLSEAQMGAVAILTVLYLGLFQLTNIGFDRYVVYAPTDNERELDATIDTVWTMQLMRGFVVMVLVLPLTLMLPLFAEFGLEKGHLIGIASTVVVLSLVNPELSRFERKGDFSYISSSRGISAFVGALVTILLVTFWSDPWVFVVGQIFNAVVMAYLSHHYCSRFPDLQFELARIREVFAYGKYIIVIAVVSFLATQGQNLYVGFMFGAVTLGAYFTWYRLVSLPGELVTQLQDKLLFAKASEQARIQDKPGQTHLIGFAFSMGLLVPYYFFIWFHGDLLMSLVAGERWVAYWWVGKAFVFLSFFYALAGTISPFALVKVPHITSRLRSLEAVSGFLLLVLLGNLYGIKGVLVAIIIEIAVAAILRIVVLYRYIITERRRNHAVVALLILAAVSGPFLLVELTLPALALDSMSLPSTLAIYMLIGVCLVMLSVIFRKTVFGAL